MLPCCSLWLLRCRKHSGTEASRRGKNWKSECRPDMIRMVENHRFLVFFTLEEQNRVTAQAKRKFSLLSHTPANRNECPCCEHFLTTPANTSILSLSLKKSEFQIRHPYKGAKSTGCLIFPWVLQTFPMGFHGFPMEFSLIPGAATPSADQRAAGGGVHRSSGRTVWFRGLLLDISQRSCR